MGALSALESCLGPRALCVCLIASSNPLGAGVQSWIMAYLELLLVCPNRTSSNVHCFTQLCPMFYCHSLDTQGLIWLTGLLGLTSGTGSEAPWGDLACIPGS